MGTFFDDDIKFRQRSLVSAEQQELFGPLSDFFKDQISKGFGLEMLGDLFEPGFLDPALRGFNREGGTRDQIQEGFAGVVGILGSRRVQTLSTALTDVQVAAQGQFIQQAPGLLNALFQPFNTASQFALTQSLENFVIQQPGLAEQINSGMDLGERIYGTFFGGGFGGGGGGFGGFGGGG